MFADFGQKQGGIVVTSTILQIEAIGFQENMHIGNGHGYQTAISVFEMLEIFENWRKKKIINNFFSSFFSFFFEFSKRRNIRIRILVGK